MFRHLADRYRVVSRLTVCIAVATLLAAGCADSSTRSESETSDSPRQRSDTGTRPAPDDAPADSPGGSTSDTGAGESTDDADAGDEPDTSEEPEPQAPEYPLTNEPYTTLQRVWAPVDPNSRAQEAIDSGELEITDIDKYKKYGLGVEPLPGQPWVEHDELAPGYPGPTASERRSLLYFWQSADPQLIDEESPIRFEGVTQAPVGSTYRPQDHLTTQVFESHVRTARRISERSGRPFDFAFVSGDMTDGGQKNEIEWTFDILNGGVVHPDSGADNDPKPGPGNDFTDPFWSRGIDVPWYMAIGNHETLYTGVLPATDAVQRAAVGDEVFAVSTDIPGLDAVDGLHNGFRDASTPTGEVRTGGKTPPDEDRRILELPELLETIHGAGGRPDGHGMKLTDAVDGVGYYSFRPLPGKPVRFIVLNTLSSDPAHASGAIDEQQFDWLKSELSQARAADELVVVGGHHRTEDFTVLSEVGSGQIENLLARYDNVVLYLVGHSHHNSIRKVAPGDNRGYWELMCASTVDYPMQSRIIEIVYDGEGFVSIYVTNIEQNAPRGTLAHFGRELAAGRKVFLPIGDGVRESWRGQLPATNLLLRVGLPDDVADRIETKSWPTRVESTNTLREFPEP